MKKYQKPQLFAESFELMEHISACSPMGRATHRNAAECAYKGQDGDKVFLDSATACGGNDPFIGELGSGDITDHYFEDVCYGDGFIADATVFSS